MAEMMDRDSYMQQAERARSSLKTTLESLNRQQALARLEVSSLVSRSETALAELAAAILTDLSPQVIEYATALTGYRTFAVVNPAAELAKAQQGLKQQMIARGEKIRVRLADIAEMPSFQNRLLLRSPRTGTLHREIAELEEFREPFARVVGKCEHPRLQRLLEVEYGQPGYSVPFWRLSYFSDWKAGDEIVARFGTDKTFAEVRSEYLHARDSLVVYDQKLDKLRAELAAGEALDREHDELLAEQKMLADGTHPGHVQLAKMPDQFLKDARIQLERYLSDLDFAMIGDRLQSNPNIDLMAKRYYGLRKQTEYLRQTSNQLLDNSRPAIEQSLTRLQRDVAKYQRPKYAGQRFSREQFDKLRERERRCQDLLLRQQQAQTAILAFGAYQNARLDDDFLWWDCITDGKIKANYIDEVARFKALHPTYRYRRVKQKQQDQNAEDDDIELLDDGSDVVVAVISSSNPGSYPHERGSDFS
jgi:hypothetical protein